MTVEKTNLILSDEELRLVNNTEWILTKRIIVEKAGSMLAALACEMNTIVRQVENLPEAVVSSSPKISKGENYRGLPYVVLDYPRCFAKENIFMIRTMFWWGNFFSITVQLGGEYKKLFETILVKNTKLLQQSGGYCCVSEDPWQHYFERDNYIEMSTQEEGTIQKLLVQKSFIKIAWKFPLAEWNNMPLALEHSFKKIVEFLEP